VSSENLRHEGGLQRLHSADDAAVKWPKATAMKAFV